MENIEAHTMKLLGTVPAGTMKSSAVHFQPDDVLYGRLRPYLNKVYRPDFEGLCSAEFIVFPKTESISSRYLQYFLNSSSFASYASHLNAGDRPRVDFEQLSPYPFPVAPCEQQELIVAEIEKQFSRLDEAVANLKRVRANLKRYKASVLKAAVEGKLTEDWRKQHPNVEPASKLLDRILAETSSKRHSSNSNSIDDSGFGKLPPTWCWSRVEDIGNVQLGRQRAPKYHFGRNMRPYLRVQNVFEDRIDLEDVMEMDFPPADFEKFRLEPDDILLNEGQSPELLGRPAIYRGELPDACFTNTLIRFRTNALMTPNYPFLVFRAYMRNGRFTKEGTITTNIAHLSAGRFAKIEFPLPPLEEQKYIVAEVERRLSVIEELEAAVEANLTRADRLRQAILTRAFEGKLIKTEPLQRSGFPHELPLAAESSSSYGATR
jgi:type I restriction enzyme S subunit